MQLCEQGARARLWCRTLLREERAQAVVEMAVVTPVLIIVALIVYNVMLFTAASARFDRIAPDIVIAHGVSPSGDAVVDVGASAATVASALEEAMASYPVTVEVEASGGGEEADTIFSLVGRSVYLSLCDAPAPVAKWSFHSRGEFGCARYARP